MLWLLPGLVTAQASDLNFCWHPEPVAELRRIYNAISQTLAYGTLEQFVGADVWQLKVILHALGYYRAGESRLERDGYDQETGAAVDPFRRA